MKVNILLKCTLIVTLIINAACIEDPPPNTNPDSPMDMVTDLPDTPIDTPTDVPVDVDPDADMTPDPCGGECAANLCVNDACVVCTADAGCDGAGEVCKVNEDPAQSSCVQCVDSNDCSGSTPICDTAANTCVGCLESSQCTEVATPECGANKQCGACTDDNACTDRVGTTRCGPAGACVQCNPDTAMVDCGGNSCVNNQCTTTPLAMTGSCGECATDAECLPDYKCVALNFQGESVGNYCLKLESGGCDLPYGAVIRGRRSVDSAGLNDYCGVNESLTTCEAVKQRLAFRLGSAPCMNDSECGMNDKDDGVCGLVSGGGMMNRYCTYRCSNDNQCGSFDGPGTCVGLNPNLMITGTCN